MPIAEPHLDRPQRAIGIVRVSVVGGREGDSVISPGDQRDRITAACERDGVKLVEVHEELDVSGGRSLAKRPGLSAAVAAIERGEADVVYAAYFDRLFRSLRTQDEVLERVGLAGGRIVAVDIGEVSNASTPQWLSGTIMGTMSEHQRRAAKDRNAGMQATAVARGAPPWSHVQLGYRRREDGTFEPDPAMVPLVQRAYEMRANGVSMTTIRAMLAENGVQRSPRGVQVMLADRIYLGEIVFGKLVNEAAHEPIIDRDLWERVQRMVVPRGRRSASDRLLARLGVLRCGTCGSRMTAMNMPKQGDDYAIYRCPSNNDCPKRMTIAVHIADRVVVDAVRVAVAGVTGRASASTRVREVEQEAERAQAALDAAIEAFDGLEAEPAARRKLADLRERRDEARARLDALGDTETAITVSADTDWDDLTVDGRRALIRAVIGRATVHPGRGAERITIELVGE